MPRIIPILLVIFALPLPAFAADFQQMAQAGQQSSPGYRKMVLIKPENDQTIHDNTGMVEVDLVLIPPLQTENGHRIRVDLDGAPLPELQTATRFHLKEVDRGTHSLQATVVDRTGTPLIATDTVTFHMWRASRLFPSRQKNPKSLP